MMVKSWTDRMTDVDSADKAGLSAHGRRPKIRQVAEEIGVSPERVRQIRAQIERWQRNHPPAYDDHVVRWREWIFANARIWLPLIGEAAREAAFARRSPELAEWQKRYRAEQKARRELRRAKQRAKEAEEAFLRAEQQAEYNRKLREFPPPPAPRDRSCMVRGTVLYDRLRTWRGIPKPILDPAAELARWNGGRR